MFPTSFAPVSAVLDGVDGRWGAPQLRHEPSTLSVRAVGVHYGQVAFEALRATPVDGRLRVFRPDLHHARLARSLDRLSMPPLPGATFGTALGALLDVLETPRDLEPGTFLYLRPLVVAVDEDWSMSGAVRFELHVLAGWTRPAFDGLPRVRARAIAADRRALSGPAGVVKVPANYGSSMVAQHRAQDIGAHTVLWLTPGERTVEEFTSMNALVVTADGVVHAPAPGPGVLDGVVRRTVLELAAEAGVPTSDAPVAWPAPGAPSDHVTALLASATAAGVVDVAGVKEVDEQGEVHTWRAAPPSDEVLELHRRTEAALAGRTHEAWWADATSLAGWSADDAHEPA